MAVKYYHKLVRDLIPDIIHKSGSICKTRVLEHEEYLLMLETKLQEEMQEYLSDKSMEEMADLMEVIRAVVAARGHTMDEVERIRIEKKQKRGGFDKRILLEEVESHD